ncbi:putative metal-binding motif-containing protein [Myxococcus stipitatus]|uniref:putative metal-binding motif-containing protein n=1 Tax=Myxococcus stipitatus TaxID=83455 RepID=UPI0031453751
MKRSGTWFVAAVSLLMGCGVPSPEGVLDRRRLPLAIEYPDSYTVGCIQVSEQSGSGATVVLETVSDFGARTPPLRLSPLLSLDWSEGAKLVITAHEQTCDGNVVARGEVEYPGMGPRYEHDVSLAIHDADRDGYMDGARAREFPGTDCDDAVAARAPGLKEVCDSLDNNCDGVVNEGLPALYRDMDGDGEGALGETEASIVCGDPASRPGYVANHLDCEDGDPKVSKAGIEICDAIDNDCDGAVDEGITCGGTLKEVTDYHLKNPAGGGVWKTVASAPSGYPVWVAGEGGRLMVRKARGMKFENFSYGVEAGTSDSPDGSPRATGKYCSDGNVDWNAAWVDSEGWVYLGGSNGQLAIHDGQTCRYQKTMPQRQSVVGMVGYEVGVDVTSVHLATADGGLYYWRTWEWTRDNAPIDFQNGRDNFANYTGLIGTTSEDGVLLVSMKRGGSAGQPGVMRYDTVRSLLVQENLAPASIQGAMNDVAGSPIGAACAVGDSGGVWTWVSGNQWTQVPPPLGVTADFSSVVKSPGGDFYIVDKSPQGQLRRLTKYNTWATTPRLPDPDAPLFDISMTTAGEFWIVGRGRVYHYPEP